MGFRQPPRPGGQYPTKECPHTRIVFLEPVVSQLKLNWKQERLFWDTDWEDERSKKDTSPWLGVWYGGEVLLSLIANPTRWGWPVQPVNSRLFKVVASVGFEKFGWFLWKRRAHLWIHRLCEMFWIYRLPDWGKGHVRVNLRVTKYIVLFLFQGSSLKCSVNKSSFVLFHR